MGECLFLSIFGRDHEGLKVWKLQCGQPVSVGSPSWANDVLVVTGPPDMFEVTQSISLRITAFHERGTFLGAPGGFYRYEVKTPRNWRWQQITMFRLPSPKPIPSDHLHRVTNNCVYFSHGRVFGVTTDGGVRWSLRGGDNPAIFSGQPDLYADIESLSIDRDGTGAMTLAHFDRQSWKALPSHSLVTADFGLTWRVQ